MRLSIDSTGIDRPPTAQGTTLSPPLHQVFNVSYFFYFRHTGISRKKATSLASLLFIKDHIDYSTSGMEIKNLVHVGSLFRLEDIGWGVPDQITCRQQPQNCAIYTSVSLSNASNCGNSIRSRNESISLPVSLNLMNQSLAFRATEAAIHLS